MGLYVMHLVSRFVGDAIGGCLEGWQVTELVKSCVGEDDPMLLGLAGGMARARARAREGGEEGVRKRIREFLGRAENRMLRIAVVRMEEQEKAKRRLFSEVVEVKDEEV